MAYTKGFGGDKPRASHAQAHAADFAAATPVEYERLADEFLGGPLKCGVAQAIRCEDGDMLRYEPRSNTFGVLTATGVIRTFFKPDAMKTPPSEYFCRQVAR
jgi:pyocin large subunit-like protein